MNSAAGDKHLFQSTRPREQKQLLREYVATLVSILRARTGEIPPKP